MPSRLAFQLREALFHGGMFRDDGKGWHGFGCGEGGVIFVCGSAACVFDDMRRAFGVYGQPSAVLGVNDIGMHLPQIDHWYSNDAPMLRKWRQARRPEYKDDPALHTNYGGESGYQDDMSYHGEFVGINSSINATRLALKLGYDKVIVCGVPCDGSGYYFAPDMVTHYDNDAVLDEWRKRVKEFEGRVVSMSGNTKWILDGC